MPQAITRHTMKSQMGFQNDAGSVYQEGGGDISFSVGMLIFQRMPLWIPQGATITAANLMWNLVVKNGDTAQNASLRIRAHAHGNSPMLRLGQNEWSSGPRPETSAYTDFNPTWPANPPGDVNVNSNVAGILQELVNRSDWLPGSYVTFITWVMNENGSDMSVRANNDFVDYPRLDVSWTEPVRDQKYTVNRLENSEFNPSILGIRSAGNNDAAPYWWQGDYYRGQLAGLAVNAHNDTGSGAWIHCGYLHWSVLFMS
jgi:hypothetical protein